MQPPLTQAKLFLCRHVTALFLSTCSLNFLCILIEDASLFQLMFSKFEYDGKLNPTFVEGPFQLPVSIIRAYIKEPITPRSIFDFIVKLKSLHDVL